VLPNALKLDAKIVQVSQARVSGSYSKGYTQAMMEATYEKFGAAKMREIEANIKVGMAALASVPAAK